MPILKIEVERSDLQLLVLKLTIWVFSVCELQDPVASCFIFDYYLFQLLLITLWLCSNN